MKRYEPPILITEPDSVYSVAIAVTDSVVFSRQLSHADLLQLHAHLGKMLDRPDATRDD